jgi:hypothetical protein
MIRQRGTEDSYTGRGGQRAVQAELMMRGCNTAIPEVDEGEDVFAFHTGRPDVDRLQVKTANAEALKEPGRYAARLSLPLTQLFDTQETSLIYVFAVRLGNRWVDFLVIEREEVVRLNSECAMGHENKRAGELQLYLSFAAERVTCSGVDLQVYRSAWERLPVFQLPDAATGTGRPAPRA